MKEKSPIIPARRALPNDQRYLYPTLRHGKIHMKNNVIFGLLEVSMTNEVGTFVVKKGLAQMLKGGVIMDVVTPEHARIAEEAGACAVMALERVPADIRADGGVARMSDPELILKIMDTVSIPVMAKCRIGHFVEAQILEALGVDYIDESEVLTPADEANHIFKHNFKVPFVCGCRNLGEALRRIGEGAAMIRTKGEAGTGDVVEAVRHARQVLGDIRHLQAMQEEELMAYAKTIGAPYELVVETRNYGKLPVVNFAAGGIATPADAALMMQLGVDGVFVGSGIFKSGNPAKRANAIVKSVTHYNDPKMLAEISRNLGEAMVGRQISSIPDQDLTCRSGLVKFIYENRHSRLSRRFFGTPAEILEKLDVDVVQVRTSAQLQDLDGLIIPGGESTTIGKLAMDFHMLEDLRIMDHNTRSGVPVQGLFFFQRMPIANNRY